MPSLAIYLLALSPLLFLGCSKDQGAGFFSGTDSGVGKKSEIPPVSGPRKTDEGSGVNTLPVGKQRLWGFATGQRTDLDRAYVNQPANIFTNAFGMPSEKRAQGNDSIWLYNKMKVVHQGTNYSRVNVIVRQNRVMKITVDPSSAQKIAKGTINPIGVPPFKH